MRWISNSTKALLRKVATSILPALLGVGAIYLILSNGFTRRTIESSKAPSDIHAAPVTKDAQDASVSENDGVSETSGPAGQDPNEATVAKSSAQAPTSAPVPTPALTPAPSPKAFATDSEFLANQQPAAAAQQSPPPTQQSTAAPQQPANDQNKSERQPGEIKRKSLERKRIAAERNRARLEKMYQKHRISSDDYKKGEEKYKNEIEEYRSAVNAFRAPRSDS
jgi:cytoskeletal protein RodZ